MIDGSDDVELELAIRGRLEHAGVDLDLLDAGAVQLAEGSYYASFLAGAAGTVDEEVRKVAALGLKGGVS